MSTVARHRLSAESFAVLARGDGSAEITQDFRVTEESRRLLLVSTLLNELADRPHDLEPLAPVATALEIITAAQQTAPEALRQLLMDPGVGSGCAYALRRLHGGARSAQPLFVDLGVVHTLALAGATRAGLPWSTRLPLRDGHVMIPTFGLARFGAGSATVEAVTEDGRITLRDGEREIVVPADGDGDNWWALRRVEVGDDLHLSVWLDDLDPLRDLGDPVAPARLDATDFARWRQLLDDAWRLLCRDYPADAAAMAGGVTSIVPLRHLPGWDTRSASNGEAFGAVMVSEPPDAVTMAVSLVHEYQHIKLGALLHLIRLTDQDDGSVYYAPWRDDPRPLAGLLQGIYAFFGIARFWRTRLSTVDGDERRIAAFEYSYALRQTTESVHIGLSAPGLTPAGRELVEGLRDQVTRWQDESTEAVGSHVDRLARLTADSHRIGWRLRHFRPSENEITAYAGLTEQPSSRPPAPAVLAPHPELRWRQRIPAVARHQLLATGKPGTPADPVAAGENALLAEDARAALAAFTGALTGLGPDDSAPISDDEARAWVGLTMSLEAGGDRLAAAALHRRPDLVRAVYAATAGRTAVTPVEVARRLGSALVD